MEYTTKLEMTNFGKAHNLPVEVPVRLNFGKDIKGTAFISEENGEVLADITIEDPKTNKLVEMLSKSGKAIFGVSGRIVKRTGNIIEEVKLTSVSIIPKGL